MSGGQDVAQAVESVVESSALQRILLLIENNIGWTVLILLGIFVLVPVMRAVVSSRSRQS